jgi:hypothetical protein
MDTSAAVVLIEDGLCGGLRLESNVKRKRQKQRKHFLNKKEAKVAKFRIPKETGLGGQS